MVAYGSEPSIRLPPSSSLRSGGATEYWIRTSNLGALQYRGRCPRSKLYNTTCSTIVQLHS
eukprot:90949-Amphidinium_carterae.1